MFLSFFLLVVVLCFIVIRPFLLTIMTSIVVAYLFYPVYRLLCRLVKNNNLAALLTLILIIAIMVVPLLFVARSLTREVASLYAASLQSLSERNLLGDEGPAFLTSVNAWLVSAADSFSLQDSLARLSVSVMTWLSNFILAIPGIILGFFIMLFLVFFMLRDGELFVKRLYSLIPLKQRYQRTVSERFGTVTKAVVYGHFLTALVQGAVGTIGLFLFGVQSPLVWGIIMTIACMIPFVGAPIVWFPLGLFKLIEGLSNDSTSHIVRGIGLLLYGFFVISLIDNFLKPKIIGDKASIHPVVIFLGVLGGLAAFGIIGMVLGPLILSLVITAAEIYKTEFS